MKRLTKRLLFLLFLATFLPQFAVAQVSISEIMYDPAGNDSGREWLEICTDAATDLTGWKFFEQGSNHGLADFRGGFNLAAGSCAVIVSDPAAFLADFSNYAGMILDSSWSSFNNSAGEELAIKDDTSNIVDFVTYNVGLGAAGDGNSLQKINGTWSAAAPTPGAINSDSSTSSDVESSNGDSAVAGGGNSSWSEYVPPEKAPKIKVEIIVEPRAIAGATHHLEARVFGTKNEPITNARIIWNFGDGARGEGRFVAHTFGYPGTYLVVADAASGEYYASARFSAIVESNVLYLSEINPGTTAVAWIEIVNPGANSADLSGWFLESAGGNFIFPDNSILMPRSFTVFSSENTKLNVWPAGEVKLLYPNGKAADVFVYGSELAIGETFQRVNGKTVVQKATPGSAVKTQNTVQVPSLPQSTVGTAQSPIVVPRVNALAAGNENNDVADNQFAAVAASAESSGSRWWLWLTASIALGIFGAVTFLFIKFRIGRESPVISSEAEEFEVEEIAEK